MKNAETFQAAVVEHNINHNGNTVSHNNSHMRLNNHTYSRFCAHKNLNIKTRWPKITVKNYMYSSKHVEINNHALAVPHKVKHFCSTQSENGNCHDFGIR